MSTIVTRAGKGSALTYTEVDSNFTNLNTDKVESTASTSVDGEIALFSSTGGKTIKRASTTGVLKASSGVIAAATAGTDYQAAITASGILKGAGAGSVSAATAGTDYTTPTGTENLSNKTLVAPVVLASTTSTQDGVIVTGRAGGTTSLRVTIAPTTLTASRAVTLPDAAGTVVLDTATQTLTNKTLTAPVISSISNTGTLTLPTSTDTLVGRATTDTLTNKTLTTPSIGTPTLTGTPIETIFALTDGATVDVVPSNGSIQTLTLAGTGRTMTWGGSSGTNWSNGQAVTLMINDGSAGTITTWNLTWVNNSGSAPTLSTTAYTVIVVWKVAGTVYGALAGNA